MGGTHAITTSRYTISIFMTQLAFETGRASARVSPESLIVFALSTIVTVALQACLVLRELTKMADESSGRTIALKRVQSIDTTTAILTRVGTTLVNVSFTAVASDTLRTQAQVTTELINTGTIVLTQVAIDQTLVHVQLALVAMETLRTQAPGGVNVSIVREGVVRDTSPSVETGSRLTWVDGGLTLVAGVVQWAGTLVTTVVW
jgi:hypothetical protein